MTESIIMFINLVLLNARRKAGAVIGGKKNAVASPRKEIRPRDGE